MSKLFTSKNRNILIVDAFIVLTTLIVLLLNIKDPIISSDTINFNKFVYTIALPIFLISVVFLCFGLFAEYKFNKLCIKNVVLLFGGIVFLNNLIMNIIMPSHFVLVTYNNVEYMMDVTITQRIYSVIICGLICISPYLLLFVVPKSLYTKKSIKIFLLVYLFVIGAIAFISFFTDFKSYIQIIKSGFSDFSNPVVSIVKSKFTFALFLFIGIASSTILENLTKKKIYILIALLLFFVMIFTYAKLPILLSFIYLLIYFCVKLFPILFKNRNNTIITLSCIGFILCIFAVLLVFTINSQTGILFKIKTIFQQVAKNSKETFSSRMIIWESTLKTLKPYQYIFGFGFYIGDIALNIAYNNNPRFPSWEGKKIFHSHNAYIECIQLGGIIYLLFYLFLIFTIIRYILKIRKYHKNISYLLFAILGYTLINGITDAVILFSDSQYIVFSSFFALITMGLYYYSCDKDELKRRKQILNDSKSIKINDKDSFIVKLNKKMHLLIAHDIKKDKNLMNNINRC